MMINYINMKFKFLSIVFFLVFASFFAVKTTNGYEKPENTFKLPDTAKALSPTLYSLGHAKDVNGRDVEGFAFVHRKDAEARAAVKPSRGGGPTCYGFMASGAKWKTAEPWLVNTANSRGLTQDFVFNNIYSNTNKWDFAAGKDVLGGGSVTNDALIADTTSTDNKNEVYFADITDSNAIAVTIVWGIFGGPPQSRELVEWDQVYDDVDYNWSPSGEPGKMDFENISTHELGHAAGMGDIYDPSCSAVTMFGYADNGEINKRSLEQPDIDGIKALYK
jgi:Matrixin.